MSRLLGKRFEQYCMLIQEASKGKTFIVHHPDMVAMDRKTWEGIQKELNPPIKTVYYDEWSEFTPEMSEELEKIIKARIK